MKKERKHNRMKGFDYSNNRLYFITSCTHKRIHHFGIIDNGVMIKNEYGKIAESQWNWLALQYPYIVLHAFVVMPNHIHGIIEIDRSRLIVGSGRDSIVGSGRDSIVGSGRNSIVGSGRDLTLQSNPGYPISPTKIKSLPELMGAYKTTVSKKIHLMGNSEFEWQRSFHDHIIRNHREYERIVNYIYSNPAKQDRRLYHPSASRSIIWMVLMGSLCLSI